MFAFFSLIHYVSSNDQAINDKYPLEKDSEEINNQEMPINKDNLNEPLFLKDF